MWTSEHHFVDDGYMPSQLPVLAAIAARTSRIGLGTGVLLAPMFDPLHLAEDAATVDLNSGGRLILGLGIGWRAEEFDGFGVKAGERGSRLEATISVPRQAWSDGLVTGDGRHARLARTRSPGADAGRGRMAGAEADERGHPEQVAEEILRYRDVLGAEGTYVARAHFPGLDPAVAAESRLLLLEEVLPLVRA